jgi:hypothetical protein
MRFLVSLLSIVVAITALAGFGMGTLVINSDNPHTPLLPWGYALTGAAGLMICLGALSSLLVWIAPRLTEKALWLATIAGVAGMMSHGVIAFLVRGFPNAPNAEGILMSVLLAGFVPAIAAAFAALLTHRVVRWADFAANA